MGYKNESFCKIIIKPFLMQKRFNWTCSIADEVKACSAISTEIICFMLKIMSSKLGLKWAELKLSTENIKCNPSKKEDLSTRIKAG